MKRMITLGLTGLVLIIASMWRDESRSQSRPTGRLWPWLKTPPQQVAKPLPEPLKPGPVTEILALEFMTNTLFDAVQPNFDMEDLVRSLELSKQTPYLTKDSNPDTGEMTIVRTKTPYPGTRYFHAQYFSGEGAERLVQHLSFEFKPGAKSFSQVVSALKKSFPNLGQAKAQREGYMKWELDNGYILWAKKLTRDDLHDDPFNAYTAQDLGTVRVAIELDIHGET